MLRLILYYLVRHVETCREALTAAWLRERHSMDVFYNIPFPSLKTGHWNAANETEQNHNKKPPIPQPSDSHEIQRTNSLSCEYLLSKPCLVHRLNRAIKQGHRSELYNRG